MVCCSTNFAPVAVVAARNWLLILVLFVLSVAPCPASEIDDVKNYYRSGDYEACIKLASEQVEKGVWNELWPRMLIEAYLATGDYPAALKAFEKAKERFGESIRMRLVGVRVYKMNNAANKAEEQLAYLEAMYVRTPWRFTNKSDLGWRSIKAMTKSLHSRLQKH